MNGLMMDYQLTLPAILRRALVATCRFEQTAYLLGGERPHLFRSGLRGINHGGDVARH
jgi:hypothetical protein